MRICLAFNPRAGTAGRIKDFLMHLEGEDRWELRLLNSQDATISLADEIKGGVFERVVLGGGDGSISQLVRALGPEFPPIDIALLPFGTGNDLARSLGIDQENLDVAFERAVSAAARPIDAVRMESEHGTTWFVNVANGGFGGSVASELRAEDKRRWGPLAYWMGSVSAIARPETYEIELTLDDQPPVSSRVLGVAVANGRFVGHGFPVARDALLDNGLLEVTTVPVLPTVELLAAGVDYVLRRELDRDRQRDRVRTYQARSVVVKSVPDMAYSIDGEAVEEFSARFEVEPGVLRLVPGLGERALRDGRAVERSAAEGDERS